MYVPPYHAMPDCREAQALIEAYPLGSWVASTAEGLAANHIPFLLDRSRGPSGTLLGHVSRGNRVWRQLAQPVPSVVMFLGPQSYITPGWYPGKQEDGKVVPTWNYAAVHAHGMARAIDDREWLHGMLARLTEAHEAERAQPWKISDAPADFIEKMLGAVVGIEIAVDRLVGKLKVSQDEALQDRRGTVAGLAAEGGDAAARMASLVRQAIGRD